MASQRIAEHAFTALLDGSEEEVQTVLDEANAELSMSESTDEDESELGDSS